MNKEALAKAVVGGLLIIPCAIAGKFVGIVAGSFLGGLAAFTVGDAIVDYAIAKLHKGEPEVIPAEPEVKPEVKPKRRGKAVDAVMA